MRTRKILGFLFISLMAASAAVAQDKVQKIDELLKTYHDYGQFNGAALVAENGRVILKKGYGKANMEWDIPVQTDTKFRIGSVTKQFTAALILQMVEEGKIKLDGKLTDYLPDYRKDTGDRVTIHQLLNHTSGIPSYTNAQFFREDSRDPYSPADFVKKFSSGDLEFEPGTKFAYNNSAYFILGAIIEKISGKPYAQVLKEKILDPLGMTNTGYDVHGTIIKHRAAGYQKTSDGYENAPYLDMSLPYAAGSMYSTVEDLYKWDQALYEDKILSAESKAKMFTPGLEGYGYGLFMEDEQHGKDGLKLKVIQHGGGINGFNSLFTRYPEKKNLVVLLDNVGMGRFHGAITKSISAILNGQPYEMPKRSIAQTLTPVAMQKGASAAIAEYKRLKTEKPNDYDFSESEVNSLGYALLGKDKTADAIEIFKFNVELFPASFNVYDSLGEAYLKAGDKKLALENYKKSLEIKPDSATGIQAVREIEGKEFKIDPKILKDYAGQYELAPNFILTVTIEGEKIMTQATGQSKIEIVPVTETLFNVPQVRANIAFVRDESGKVTSLILDQGGRKMPAKKIN